MSDLKPGWLREEVERADERMRDHPWRYMRMSATPQPTPRPTLKPGWFWEDLQRAEQRARELGIGVVRVEESRCQHADKYDGEGRPPCVTENSNACDTCYGKWHHRRTREYDADPQAYFA